MPSSLPVKNLLLPVCVKVFKSEDIEDSDGFAVVGRGLFGTVDGSVDLVYDPDEHSAVDPLDARVSHVNGRHVVHRRGYALALREDRLRRQRIYHVLRIHLRKQCRLR